jgi:hypothetical protein
MHWISVASQEKCTSFVTLEQFNKYTQIAFINFSLFLTDWLDSLIGPGGLLLVVSHIYAVPVRPLSVRLEKKVLN